MQQVNVIWGLKSPGHKAMLRQKLEYERESWSLSWEGIVFALVPAFPNRNLLRSEIVYKRKLKLGNFSTCVKFQSISFANVILSSFSSNVFDNPNAFCSKCTCHHLFHFGDCICRITPGLVKELCILH